MILHPDLLRAVGRERYERLHDQAKRKRLRNLNLSQTSKQASSSPKPGWRALSKSQV